MGNAARQRLNARTIRVSLHAALRATSSADLSQLRRRARQLVAMARATTTDEAALRELAGAAQELDARSPFLHDIEPSG